MANPPAPPPGHPVLQRCGWIEKNLHATLLDKFARSRPDGSREWTFIYIMGTRGRLCLVHGLLSRNGHRSADVYYASSAKSVKDLQSEVQSFADGKAITI